MRLTFLSRWHYELLFIAMCLVVATTGGGRHVLFR
jgi:hypothetical protein